MGEQLSSSSPFPSSTQLSDFSFPLSETKTVSRPIVIANFPNEILIEIFTYLSANDLKRVNMTSHVFNQTVGQSSRLMKKFLLKISPKRKWDLHALVDFERKHQNVKLMNAHSKESSTEVIIEGITCLRAFLKHVEISDCVLSIEDLTKVFEKLRQVTNIVLINVKLTECSRLKLAELSGKPNFVQKLPKFNSLTHLEIVKCDCFFELFLKARNLQDVSVELGDQKNLNLKCFEHLLLNQSSLKALELIDIQFSDFLEEDLQFPFCLTSLTIQHCHFKVKEHLEKFIERQDNLKCVDLTVSSMKLKLDRSHYFEESLALVIAMQQLTEVSLDIENYNFANFKFLTRAINQNVRKLRLSVFQSSCSVNSILKVFPMIEKLDICSKEMGEDDISYFNEHLDQLLELKVSKRFPSEAFGRLKLKRLKSLHMNETNVDIEHWSAFLVNNPSITKLIINFNFFVDLSEDLIDTITKSLKLEHVELIDKWIGMRNDIYEMICCNCESLKYLKLWNINVEKDFDEDDKNYLRERNIKFHLFNDESLNAPMVPF